MTTYIERIVTEVVVEPERPESGAEIDRRWVEKRKVEAVLKSLVRQQERLSAEGFDD